MGSFYKNYLNKFGDNQHGPKRIKKLTKQDNESHHKYEYKRRTSRKNSRNSIVNRNDLGLLLLSQVSYAAPLFPNFV